MRTRVWRRICSHCGEPWLGEHQSSCPPEGRVPIAVLEGEAVVPDGVVPPANVLDAWQRDGSAAYIESICSW